MFPLDPMETSLITGIGFGIIIITIVIVTCFMDPRCIGYKWIRKRSKKVYPSCKNQKGDKRIGNRRNYTKETNTDEVVFDATNQERAPIHNGTWAAVLGQGHKIQRHKKTIINAYLVLILHKDKSGVANGENCEGIYKRGYEMFASDSLGKQGGSVISNAPTKRDSCYSSMSDTSEGIIGNRNPCPKNSLALGGSDLQVNYATYSNNYFGEVVLRFLHLLNENDLVGKIFITIQEANNLQPRQYLSPTANSFIEVMAFPTKSIYRSVFEERRSSTQRRVFSFRTRTVRGTISPHYDETFLAALDVKSSDLKSWHIMITAFDDDKYGNSTELGCTDFPLKSAVDRSGEEIIYKCCLKQPKRNLGAMLLSINYLPTAERLVFHIVKVSNLDIHSDTESPTNFTLQVHVLLLSGMGRVLKRRKTSAGHGKNGQLFEETIPFKVPSSQLTSLTCLLFLCAKASEESKEVGSSDKGEESHLARINRAQTEQRACKEGQSKKNAKGSKEECIGKVLLGATVRVPEGQSHWLSMMQKPRNAVSMWHKLR